MLLPALNKAREKARGTACLSNMKQLNLAWFSYASDNKDYIVNYDRNYYSGTSRLLWYIAFILSPALSRLRDSSGFTPDSPAGGLGNV